MLRPGTPVRLELTYTHTHAVLQSAVNVETTKMRLGKSLTRVSSTALSAWRGSRIIAITFTRWLTTLMKLVPYFVRLSSSVESQKGVIAAQRCSVENQKGAIAVQSQWQSTILVLNGTYFIYNSVFLVLSWRYMIQTIIHSPIYIIFDYVQAYSALLW